MLIMQLIPVIEQINTFMPPLHFYKTALNLSQEAFLLSSLFYVSYIVLKI